MCGFVNLKYFCCNALQNTYFRVLGLQSSLQMVIIRHDLGHRLTPRFDKTYNLLTINISADDDKV